MPSKSELSSFILEASRATYASANSSTFEKQKDHSTTITFTQGDWSYQDNFFGGEPFGGREVVFYNTNPYWMMVYYGTITSTYHDFKSVYMCLQEALRNGTQELPMRGPKEFKKNDFTYSFYIDGTIDQFTGIELIKKNGRCIYTAHFSGGLVDQRKE